MELTAPQEASVVMVANRADWEMPKRVFLAFHVAEWPVDAQRRAAADCRRLSAHQQTSTPARNSTNIAPQTVQPCDCFLTMRPR